MSAADDGEAAATFELGSAISHRTIRPQREHLWMFPQCAGEGCTAPDVCANLSERPRDGSGNRLFGSHQCAGNGHARG
jgi:hypothetical protein